METVKQGGRLGPASQPSPALYAATLRLLSNAAPRFRSMVSTLTDFVAQLTPTEAEYLPQALGGVLPLLRGDPEKLKFAANIATRLDFFEAIRPLADLAATTGDPDLILMAATLCGNPAVGSSIKTRVANLVGDDVAGRIRLDQHTVPKTADEERLYLQCWPGARTRSTRFPLAPVVVLDNRLDAKGALQLALRLRKAGAVVRRLDLDSEVPFWFGAHTTLLCHHLTRSRVRRRYPDFSEDRIRVEGTPQDERQLTVLLRAINATLTPPIQLRLTEFTPDISTNIFDPEVFAAGVYQTKEVTFLSGASRSSVDSLRKRELLTPRSFSPGIQWAFRDLVAVRTWKYLNSIAEKRVSSDVVPALSDYAGDSQAVRLGVMANGKVHVDHGDGWVNAKTGQRQFEMPITDIDDVFRPFTFGGGRTVVPLLSASRNTKLHPAILRGAPRLRGHRISAVALARMDRRGGRKAILSAYPELENRDFDDTVGIGLQLIGPTS